MSQDAVNQILLINSLFEKEIVHVSADVTDRWRFQFPIAFEKLCYLFYYALIRSRYLRNMVSRDFV